MGIEKINEKFSFTLDSICKYFPDLKNCQINTRVLRLFSVDESIFSGIKIEAKAQFLGLYEDNKQKIGF